MLFSAGILCIAFLTPLNDIPTCLDDCSFASGGTRKFKLYEVKACVEDSTSAAVGLTDVCADVDDFFQ